LDAENRGNRSLEEPFPVPQPTLSKQNQTSDRQKQPVDIGPPGIPAKPIQLTTVATPRVNPEQPKAPVAGLQRAEKPTAIPATPANDAIPLLAGMPSDFQREVPSLNINVFVYSEIPEERFIVINMSKYLAGQKIDSGPEILEIRPDSLVLEYLGRKFRIKRP
ncbi:MAG: general secretion pathway protein GspB, partial [Methylococcales bacterium]